MHQEGGFLSPNSGLSGLGSQLIPMEEMMRRLQTSEGNRQGKKHMHYRTQRGTLMQQKRPITGANTFNMSKKDSSTAVGTSHINRRYLNLDSAHGARVFSANSSEMSPNGTSNRFAPQIEKGQFIFQQIDFLQENFQEPDFIRQHRDEFDMFLMSTRPDLNSPPQPEEFKDLNSPLIGSMSPISRYYHHKRCPRFVRNFGSAAPQLPDEYQSQILVQDPHQRSTSPKIGGILKNPVATSSIIQSNTLRLSSSLMQTYSQMTSGNKLVIPCVDKDKLKCELNSLVAYRHRRLQILKKLEADLSQIKFTNSQSTVFAAQMPKVPATTATSPRRLCCSPPQERKSPTKLLMYGDKSGLSATKSQMMSMNNIYEFDKTFKGGFSAALEDNESIMRNKRIIYSRKSQFGMNTIEQQDQVKKMQLNTQADVFSIVDLEFYKVQLMTKFKVRESEIDEALLENFTLNHQLTNETRQNIINKKMFNELLPYYDEQVALGKKYEYIEQLNYFRKFVAEHNLKEKTDELVDNHEDHKVEISRQLELLRAETFSLHKTSQTMQEREDELHKLKAEINEIRYRKANLANIKRQWINFLKMRYKEYRIVKILRIFSLIGLLAALKSRQLSRSQQQNASSLEQNSRDEIPIQDEDEEEQRAQIFGDLQQTIVQLTQLTDFRAFCNQVLNAELQDLERFFQQDDLYKQQYEEVKDNFNEDIVTHVYNQSQFVIASLTGRHEFLVNQRENKKGKVLDLKRLKNILLHNSDEIVAYLQEALGIAKRHQLDFTAEDLVFMRQVEGKYLKEQKLTLQYLLPQMKAQIFHMDSHLGLISSVIRRNLTESDLLDVTRMYLINYEARDVTGRSKKSSSLLTEVQEEGDGGDNNPSRAESRQKQKKSLVMQSKTGKVAMDSQMSKKKSMKPTLTIGLGKQGAQRSAFSEERYQNASPSSGFDLSDANEMHLYLSKLALDSKDVLSRLGIYIKQCLTNKQALQDDLNGGKSLVIDYAFFERQFHENHYMRTSLPQHAGGSHSSTPWGISPQPHSVHFADLESQPEKYANKEIKSSMDYQIQSPHMSQATSNASTKAPGERTDDAFGARHTKTAAASSRRGSDIEMRTLYLGSDLMNQKFKRVREMQQFECRERQFLRQFKKRIHESYNHL